MILSQFCHSPASRNIRKSGRADHRRPARLTEIVGGPEL
jgi:hypothetical protein